MRFFLQTESVTNNNNLRSEYNANYIEGLSESWCNDCLSSSMKIMKWGCGWSMSSLSSAASWCFFHIICDSSKQQGQFIIIYMYIYMKFVAVIHHFGHNTRLWCVFLDEVWIFLQLLNLNVYQMMQDIFFHPDSPSACERVAGSPGSSHPSYLSSMTMMTCRSHQLALKCIKVPKLCKRTSSIWPWIGWLTYDLHLIQSWRITLDFLWSFSPGHTCPGCVDLIVA